MNIELTPKSEIYARMDGLRRRMAEAGIDFAIILQNVDIFYFTGTLQRGALVVPLDSDPMFFVEKGLERARLETPLPVTPIKNDKAIKDILRHKKILRGTGGMELDVLPVSVFERFKKTIGFETFVDVSPLIKELRQVKSPFEIEQIKKSGEIMRHVFAKAKHLIRGGARELDIDAALVAEGRKRGHQGFLRMRGFNLEMTTITVVGGYTGAMPSCSDVAVGGMGVTPAVPLGSSFNKVEKGIPISIDYGGGYNGYVTDETYVFVLGEMGKIFRKPYEISREIIEDAATYGREGVDASQLFSRAAAVTEKARLEPYFMGFGEGKVSFIGHGLGLEINELPVITPRHHTILKEGMVFALEPKFTLPGKGAIGMEVDFIVRKNHLERVTDISLDITKIKC
ncbi:MAG TPA: Xaa-Pro peptidase family protein [Syntrophorhabdales bacterium]|nr:Xaa-Pro peptidase family protein [Syntrophorhabdales bacterium]